MTKLVGILNITPDSFSDGGKFNQLNAAITQTHSLIKEGANIIDIGAESTRPNAQLITPIEEWERLKTILPDIIKITKEQNCKISLDTRHAITAQKGLDLGIDIINDVSGMNDPEMGKIIRTYDVPIIINHNLGLPASPTKTVADNKNIITTLNIWGKQKILELTEQHSIKKENIIFDVGIGFGKTPKQSLEIMSNMKSFKTLGVPLYVGHSRKSFLKLYNPKSILAKDLLTGYFSAKIASHTDYIRIHNVAITKEYIDLKLTSELTYKP